MLPLFQIDAFTDRAFAGNPAAVVLLDAARSERWMQQVAAEMNLSETAFVAGRPDGTFDLRWFTPRVEVDLCGHATLAAAHVLWEVQRAAPERAIEFHTRSGLLGARRDGEWIELDFPADPPTDCEGPGDLEAALGAKVVEVKRGRSDLLAVLENERAVRELAPNLRAIAEWPMRGVMVTARADEAGCDFVSRFFGPLVGVDEDPVTGSAHTTLGPYWAGRLGKREMVGYQASPRGGTVRVRIGEERVQLGGRAVTVFRGLIRV